MEERLDLTESLPLFFMGKATDRALCRIPGPGKPKDVLDMMIASTSIAWLVVAIGLGLLLAGRFAAPRRRRLARGHPVSARITPHDHLERLLQQMRREPGT